MDHFEGNERKTAPNLRVMWLLLALLAAASLFAADFGFATRMLGMVFLMIFLGIFTVILMSCRPAVTVATAILSFAVFYLASGMMWEPLIYCAIGLVGALLLSMAIRRKSTKTSAVLTVAAVLGVCFLILAAVTYAMAGHSLAPKDVLADIGNYFEAVKAEMVEDMRASINAISDTQMAYYERLGITREDLLAASIENVKTSVDLVMMLLPSITLISLQVLACIAVCAFSVTVRRCRYDALLPEPRWILYPTKVSCVIYWIAAVLYLISRFFNAFSAFSVVVTNFFYVILPPMGACGVRGLRARLRHPMLRRRMIFILILFGAGILFFASAALPIAVLMLASLGAGDVFAARMAESSEDKKS